ncbi:MAG: hypothetical protein J0G29_01295, partial [Alphaproteobacteria bacterium]|nr:hypothetical protein [Alphaproteobacteria bacterium]
ACIGAACGIGSIYYGKKAVAEGMRAMRPYMPNMQQLLIQAGYVDTPEQAGSVIQGGVKTGRFAALISGTAGLSIFSRALPSKIIRAVDSSYPSSFSLLAKEELHANAGLQERLVQVEVKQVVQAKTYQTYTKYNPSTGETYVGRTSGVRDPRDNVRLRDRDHHMDKYGYERAIIDETSTSSKAIRGREQLKLEEVGGAQSQGGIAGNKINAISDKNPKKQEYLDAAKKEFRDD